jgi:7,8-dihydropterin-6-yl-methyl-4-(beta-D-ribofuranosyl)aminobenzene 5'-phosphate synthase
VRDLQKIVIIIVIALAAYASYPLICEQSSPTPELPKEVSEGYLGFAEITVLVDNNPEEYLKSPWGVSIYVKTQDLSILFDAGPDPQALKENSEKLGVDLKTLDLAVISHEHGDHVRGLSYVAEVNENLTVYVPEHMSTSCKKWIRGLGLNVVEIESTTMISRGIAVIGELYGPPFEQALAINVKDLGLIILVGCSHPGVDNLVAKAAVDLKSKPYAVIGGFHLSGASLDRIRSASEKLVEAGLKKIYPIHCSGEKIRSFLEENYPEVYGGGRVGLKLIFRVD